MADRVRIGILGGGGILGAHGPTYAMITDQCEWVTTKFPHPVTFDDECTAEV